MSCRNVKCIELAQIPSGGRFAHVQNLSVTLRVTVSTNVSIKHPASYFRWQDGCRRFVRQFRTRVPRKRQQCDSSGAATGLLGLFCNFRLFFLVLATRFYKVFTPPRASRSSAFPRSNEALYIYILLAVRRLSSYQKHIVTLWVIYPSLSWTSAESEFGQLQR